jgi:hypothetical protein
MTHAQVRALQRDLNDFCRKRLLDIEPLIVDGDLGYATRRRIKFVKYFLGLVKSQRKGGGLSEEFLARLRHPKSLKVYGARGLQLALRRRAKQRAEARKERRRLRDWRNRNGFAIWEGKTVAAWTVYWLDRSRAKGWHGTVASGVRTAAYSTHLCIVMCGHPSCPGRCAGRASNHNMEQAQGFPAGALDVTDYAAFGRIQPHGRPAHRLRGRRSCRPRARGRHLAAQPRPVGDCAQHRRQAARLGHDLHHEQGADASAGHRRGRVMELRPNASTPASLRIGAQGWPVYGLQAGLASRGAPIVPDGDFGPITQRETLAFQKRRSLTADGIAGPATQMALALQVAASIDAESLPKLVPWGLAASLIEGESGYALGAVNWSVPGGVDCGLVQLRVYEPYERGPLVQAYSPFRAITAALADISTRAANYLTRAAVAGRNDAGEYAVRLAVLAHNWPWAAEELAAGRALSTTKEATWVKVVRDGQVFRPRFPDGIEVFSYRDWAEFYALGGKHGAARMTKYVLAW